jgi:hypothetical protein
VATVAAETAAAATAAREIFHIKIIMLNIKLGRGGGGVAEWDGPLVDQSEAAKTTYSRGGHAAAVVSIVVVVLSRGIGGGSGSTATCCREQAANGAGGAPCNYDEEVGKRATVGAGNGGKSRDK